MSLRRVMIDSFKQNSCGLQLCRCLKRLKGKLVSVVDSKSVQKACDKSTSIFDIQALSKNVSDPIDCIFMDNYYYGNDLAVKKVLKKKEPYLLIEHGYYFGNHVPKSSFEYSNVHIVTYGYQRFLHIKKAFLESQGKARSLRVTTIGPYIHYATSVLSYDEKNTLNSQYGEVLLVFPTHSIEGVTYSYDLDIFHQEIERVSEKFDSIFVCMYWKDIQDGKHVYYENKGYKIVSAGHRNDSNFLGRLKDIIELSTMTMSNSIGTHIGYCISLNKPHYLFCQDVSVEGEKVDLEFGERSDNDYIRTRNAEYAEIIAHFSSYRDKITNQQLEVTKKYWGENSPVTYFITK